jgi:glycosyltransferase involved in cell wall biosynthesis
MKILFLTGEFPPMQGGVGDYTREIGLALKALGCQVHVLGSVEAGPVSGLTVHPVIRRWNWTCWGTICDLIQQEQPDIIHIQYQAAAYDMHPAINLLPRRLHRLGSGRPRTVVTFHDLKVPYLFPKAGPLRRRAIDELARSSDAAVTTNRADYEELEQRLGNAPVLIPIGTNIQPRLPEGYNRTTWRAGWGVGLKDLLLCFFGFVNDRKGVDDLLRALHILTREGTGPGVDSLASEPNPFLLMIGGQTGASDPTNIAYLAQIRELILELELQDRICWTDYVPGEEVTASFEAADLCVLPFREGASFLHGTLLAALAHGVPIITTQPAVPLPELQDGRNVLLVPAEQPAALASAITRLADDAELCHVLAKGAKTLSEQFRWETIAATTLDLYRNLL